MDTSEVYIKMCREAKEIQEVCKYEYGDIIHIVGSDVESRNGIYLYGSNGFKYDRHYHHEIYPGSFWQIDEGRTTWYFHQDAIVIWLPRQDQLQEMVYNGRNLSVFYGFRSYVMHHIVNDLDDTDEADLESWEQLWLTFVMKEKYNKKWNRKIWIKE